MLFIQNAYCVPFSEPDTILGTVDLLEKKKVKNPFTNGVYILVEETSKTEKE